MCIVFNVCHISFHNFIEKGIIFTFCLLKQHHTVRPISPYRFIVFLAFCRHFFKVAKKPLPAFLCWAFSMCLVYELQDSPKYIEKLLMYSLLISCLVCSLNCLDIISTYSISLLDLLLLMFCRSRPMPTLH